MIAFSTSSQLPRGLLEPTVKLKLGVKELTDYSVSRTQRVLYAEAVGDNFMVGSHIEEDLLGILLAGYLTNTDNLPIGIYFGASNSSITFNFRGNASVGVVLIHSIDW
jgi:hypothetical protein